MLGHALIQAMLLGDLKNLPEEIVFLYQRTGLIHLFSASGFHMAVAITMANIAGTIFQPIRDRRAREGCIFFLGIIMMTFFGNATAWSSPMVRAYTYTSVRSLARWLGWKENKNWVFLLSLLIASVLGKGSTLSFLLSAAGMAGVIYFPNYLGIFIGPWLATLPISVFSFHLFSLSSLFWNLTLGTVMAFTCLPLAILSLLLKSVSIPTGKIDFWAAKLAEAFTHFLQIGEEKINLAFWVPQIPWIIATSALYLFWKTKSKFRYIFLGALVAPLYPSPSLSVLNIGQGDAIYLRTEAGHNLVDTGPVGYLTSKELGNLTVAKINHLLITHPDRDHRGGIQAVSLRHRVEKLWLREKSIQIKGGIEILSSAERAQIPIFFLERESSPPGFHCWFAPSHDRNDLSPLCQVQLKNKNTVLLTGDMSGQAEIWFSKNISPFPISDYLKIAHHGSHFSSSAEFLWASQAKVALISVGEKNRYGHPHRDSLERMEKAGMEIRRTDQEHTLNIY